MQSLTSLLTFTWQLCGSLLLHYYSTATSPAVHPNYGQDLTTALKNTASISNQFTAPQTLYYKPH